MEWAAVGQVATAETARAATFGPVVASAERFRARMRNRRGVRATEPAAAFPHSVPQDAPPLREVGSGNGRGACAHAAGVPVHDLVVPR